jgi:hypothetical protein
MKIFLTASKDTTIYQAYPTNNAGLDEILEIGKTVDTALVEPSYITASARALLQFELPTTESVSTGSSYYLNLKLAHADNVKRNQKLLVYQVSRSWDEGSGYFYQDVQNANDGATWKQATTSVSWSMGGGDFLTGSMSASVTLSEYPLGDLRIDVTNIISPIVSQSLQSTFYGLAIQFPTADEIDANNKGNVKVFSTQTHTIYQPTLEVSWNNQSFITGSLVAVPSSLNVKIVPSNLKQVYTKGDVSKINLVVRDEYPLKNFDSVLRYKNKYYLPSSSYYSIVDTQSNTTVVNFDDGSRINTDATGSYIILDTSPLYSGRFYTLKIKINANGYTRTVNTDTMFQVE